VPRRRLVVRQAQQVLGDVPLGRSAQQGSSASAIARLSSAAQEGMMCTAAAECGEAMRLSRA
jgi:hypothetical protein